MTIYQTQGRWHDTKKDEQLIKSIITLITEHCDYLLSTQGCRRTGPASWASEELDVLFCLCCVPRSERTTKGEKAL